MNTETNTPESSLHAFLARFLGYYRGIMVEAAPQGDEACLAAMNRARDTLQGMMGCPQLQADNLIRGIHCIFCREIGHEVPAAHLEKVIATFKAGLAGPME